MVVVVVVVPAAAGNNDLAMAEVDASACNEKQICQTVEAHPFVPDIHISLEDGVETGHTPKCKGIVLVISFKNNFVDCENNVKKSIFLIVICTHYNYRFINVNILFTSTYIRCVMYLAHWIVCHLTWCHLAC